ncbi:ABC transporter ATP-binding protein [Halomicrococcus sp. SG-WS-1]|uniref:ABC transporter ATP-binding protein n=1 Tax=Halomicrococcus sp. SG-WS-1 TaxID=3439057 RepID=UPI003F7A691E
MAAIETQSLTKRFGSLHAVRDVDLHVERGEVFGFLGPNGAGKSTTINILLDFVRRTSGEISVLGHDPEETPRAVRERTGVLAEATGYYGRDSAHDHLRFAVEMKRADDDPDDLLERVGIADAAHRPVGGFSKGMRQRLGLGMALVGEPELLILDEPLGGLDPDGARLLRQIVREERDRGAAVFFSSHIMDQVEAICDRVGIMHDGELVAADTLETLRASTETPATFSVSLESVTDGLARDVASVEGVADVRVRDDTLVVACTESTAKAGVVARIDGSGATIVDIDNEVPSLEQVFRSITDGADES